MADRGEPDIPPRNMKKHNIIIGFKDDEKSNRTVPRNRLLMRHMEKLFKVKIDFLLDQFGEVLYPEQWISECQGRPYYYTVVQKQQPPPIEDANMDPDYIGDASVFVENVPVNVDAISMEAWLKTGIQSETSQIEKMRNHLAKGMATVRGIEAKLQEVPFLDVDADNEKDAAEARKEIAQLLEKEILLWEKKILKRRKILNEFEFQAKNMPIQLEVFEVNQLNNTNTWLCQFDNAKAKLASKLCRKPDWAEYKLALFQKGFMGEDDSPPLVLFGRRTEFPIEYEEDQRIVNMRLVRVCRRRHGQGSYVHELDNEIRVTKNWYYRGDFRLGKRHGAGKCDYWHGKYTGEFVDDCERDTSGHATLLYADSSGWKGGVGRALQHSLSLIQGNEYAMGGPHGQGELSFADGSSYRGEMHNGTVLGKGVYKDAHTGTSAGTFRQGMLNGDKCVVHGRTTGMDKYGGYIQEGTFLNDALHRKGRLTFPKPTPTPTTLASALDSKEQEKAPDGKEEGKWMHF
jgi:hypothetical protein